MFWIRYSPSKLNFSKLVISQIEQAFQGGYDPALELAKQGGQKRHMTDAIDEGDVGNGTLTVHLRRMEQDILDRIIHGDETGHYYMILGCKVSLFICPRIAY
jgi:hypothetical protein